MEIIVLGLVYSGRFSSWIQVSDLGLFKHINPKILTEESEEFEDSKDNEDLKLDC